MNNSYQNLKFGKLVLAGKIFITGLLVAYSAGFFISPNFAGLVVFFGFFVLVFLPTMFVFWFKNRLLLHFGFAKFWKFGRFFYWFFIFMFLGFMVFGFYRGWDKDRTD